MRNRRPLRTLGLVAVSGLIGYLIGPPLVQAATNVVVIKDADSSAKAQVANGRLKVDTELPPVSGPLSVDTEAGLDANGRLRVETELPAYGDSPGFFFAFIAHHTFDFANDPADGLVPQTDSSTHTPCSNPGPDHMIVTGVDVSQSLPTSGGAGQLVRLWMETDPGFLQFDQYHPQGFHDDTGIKFPIFQDTFSISTEMRGAAGQSCSPDGCVLLPESFTVPVVVQGYCEFGAI